MASTTENSRESEYLIVDFPEESKDGQISMALISSSWVFLKNGTTCCYWPSYLKSTLGREKAVKNHSPLIQEKCVECVVLIKYSCLNYEKAVQKLRKMEEESELSTISDFDESIPIEREFLVNTKRNGKTIQKKDKDFIYNYDNVDTDSGEEIPQPPAPPKAIKTGFDAIITGLDAIRKINVPWPSGPPEKTKSFTELQSIGVGIGLEKRLQKKDKDFIYNYDNVDVDNASDEEIPQHSAPPKAIKTLTGFDAIRKINGSEVPWHSGPEKTKSFTELQSIGVGIGLEKRLPPASSETTNSFTELEHAAVANHNNSEALNINSRCHHINSRCHQCEKNKNMLERILRDLQIIKADIKHFSMAKNQETISKFETLDTSLSFETYEDLCTFDSKLGRDIEFHNKLLTTLSLLGGRDLQETTKKLMSTIISHNLSLKINWIGVNEKGSLKKLENSLKLIYAAVRRNPTCANATNVDIDKAIKTWIKNASDREGGRTNREKKQKI